MSDKLRQPIFKDCTSAAIGLEVHVQGWGTSPFFTVRGYNPCNDRVELSKRYTKRIFAIVPRDRVYLTRPCAAKYLKRIQPQGAQP